MMKSKVGKRLGSWSVTRIVFRVQELITEKLTLLPV